MINSYTFGQITINGKKYHNDLIIYPDHLETNWWRQEGHSLSKEDLTEVIKAKPSILIIGTGARGVMKVPEKTREYVKEQGIKLIIQSTKQACITYNEFLKKEKNVIACLHLTC